MYMLIPIEMCKYAITNKFIRPLQLYIYLKTQHVGCFKLELCCLKKIANDIGLKSVKTVKTNLELLIKRNWVGLNNKSGNYFVRGFEAVRRQEGFNYRASAIFYISDIKEIKAFTAGAVISYLVRQQKRRDWVAGRLKRRSLQATQPSSQYYPVAILALAKILNISFAKAHRIRELAAKKGFIFLRQNFQNTDVEIGLKLQYQKCRPDIANRMRIKSHKVMLQLISTVLPLVELRKRKKMKAYSRGYRRRI